VTLVDAAPAPVHLRVLVQAGRRHCGQADPALRCRPAAAGGVAHRRPGRRAACAATAERVALTPGRGYFVQSVGSDAGAPPAGSAFWISDTGVRYGWTPPRTPRPSRRSG
jgi:hypothetical protein